MSGIDDLISSESGQKASDIDSLIASEGGASGTPAAAAPTVATPQSYLASLGAGLGHGFGSTVLGAQQLVGHGLEAIGSDHVGPWLVNDANKGISKLDAQVAPYSAANPMTTGAGKLVGGAVAAAPLAAAAPGGAIVGGALAGGAAGAVQPVDPNEQDFWQQKLQQGAAGAALGGAGGAVVGGIGRMLSPRAATPQIADLMNRGVQPTAGQIAGGGANRLEQALTSMPFVGNSIATRRAATIAQANRAAYADALDPIGAQLPDAVQAGGAGVQHVGDTIGQAYDALESGAQFNYDGMFHRDLTGIRNQLSQAASPSTVDQFDNILRNQITNKMDPNTGEMDGTAWGTSRSMLGSLERNFRGVGGAQTTADQTALANAVGDLQDAMNSNVVRNSPQGLQDDLANANLAYARYKRIENAAGSVGAMRNDNVFTPAQYMSAVRRGSTAQQRATGTGLNNDFADSMQALSNNMPDSGTTERAGAIGTLLALPHVVAHPGIIPGAIAARAAYSPLGNRLIGSAMTARPALMRQMGNAVQGAAIPTATGAGVLGGGLLQGSDPDQQQ